MTTDDVIWVNLTNGEIITSKDVEYYKKTHPSNEEYLKKYFKPMIPLSTHLAQIKELTEALENISEKLCNPFLMDNRYEIRSVAKAALDKAGDKK